jgi:hypothetical protein
VVEARPVRIACSAAGSRTREMPSSAPVRISVERSCSITAAIARATGS